MIAFLDKGAKNGQAAICGGMDEVNFHAVVLAIYCVFTGVMKMKLKKFVILAFNTHLATVEVCLNRVTIVDNLSACSPVAVSCRLQPDEIVPSMSMGDCWTPMAHDA